MAIVIVAKNIGRSVALDVGIHGSMTLTEDERGLYKEQLDTCSRGAFLSPLLTVFPNDDTDNTFFIYGVVDIPAKIDHSFTTGRDAPILAPRNSKLVAPTFVGCITYTYPSTRKTHYSGFRFGLEYKEMLPRDAHLDRFTAQMFNKDHVHIAGYFVVGRDVSKEKLLVERFFSGFYAN
ncbi:MAG: hypothetical protein JO138_16595 [Acidobacteriaceae bacterium]|nr:hypothetical protein [Acidobacteriaceae bacterium]